ncbi:ATP-binding cassette domain-containing protein, partial [Cellulomonas triticagri]
MSADRQDGLTARLVVTRGDLHLDLRLTVAPGQVVALLGPNGTGKSTALGALAGLVPTAPGTDVRLGGHVLDGPGVHVPSAGRRCGLVFQDLRLFGHLSARENVAFGLRATGAPAGAARVAADGWLARLGLVDRAAVRTDRLSGGQAQRVALARALAPDPALLLLDEPFASLDAATRRRVRGVLRAAIGSRPVLLVTHDPEDVRDLADDVLTLADPDGTGTVRATRTTRDAAPGPASGPDVAAVVLAGGTARRLGGVDKTALDVGGRAVLDRLLTGLRPSVPDVVLVADPGTATSPWPRRVREDPPGSGPAAALAAGARAV